MSTSWTFSSLLLLGLLAIGCHPPVMEPISEASTAQQVSSQATTGLEPLRVYLKGRRSVAVEVLSSDARVVRSTDEFDLDDAPRTELPRGASLYVDELVADGVTYYYGLFRGSELLSVREVSVPDIRLPELGQPRIEIDKTQFTLSVFDGDRIVKRYPVALGVNPTNRKLQYDMASTPEGDYTIIGLQPTATYYRAYDLDYPNEVDRARYRFAQEHLELGDADIGGEIQIHGRGIGFNWTGGCIALRDKDMDELFSHDEIDTGVRVRIIGQELTREDFHAIETAEPARVRSLLIAQGFLDERFGNGQTLNEPEVFEALGLFQVSRKLPVTCQPDQRTLKSLE